jgi:hypothetical protein
MREVRRFGRVRNDGADRRRNMCVRARGLAAAAASLLICVVGLLAAAPAALAETFPTNTVVPSTSGTPARAAN